LNISRVARNTTFGKGKKALSILTEAESAESMMALAYALDFLERNQLVRITNYGEYLAPHPPIQKASHCAVKKFHAPDP
jgi:hypothetical protein